MTTIQDAIPAPAPLEDPPQLVETPDEPQEHVVVAHLRECLNGFMADADRLAEYGGIERKTAAEHLAQAAFYDDAAVTVRAQADIWRLLLDKAIAEVAAEQPDAALAVAEARGNPYPPTPPMIHCGECGTAIRPLTTDEQAAIVVGQPLPDVRSECPDCLIHVAPEQS